MKVSLVFAIASISHAAAPTGPAAIPQKTCKDHICEQEKAKGIEPGLLHAIATIESKLHPHAVNACGRAYHFKSAAEAASFVEKKQKEGVKNISVGPCQLHVPSHRGNFKTLKAMIEPEHNIAYAAKLLKKLKSQTGSTERAVELYHSPDPEASSAYKTRVFGAWSKIRKSAKSAKVQEIVAKKQPAKS